MRMRWASAFDLPARLHLRCLECANQVLFFTASQNLTTRVDALEFNHDGQILALASRMKKDALKMVWIGSTTTVGCFAALSCH
jgi:hypothetical protein